MLNIWFGPKQDVNYPTPETFDISFEPEWLDNSLVRDMIKAIDKSEVVGERSIKSPILGTIAPSLLSGGVKTCIMMLYMPEYEYYGTACGDNCAKWFLRIAELHNINITLCHFMHFPDPIIAKIVNIDKIIHSSKELFHEYITIKGDGWTW